MPALYSEMKSIAFCTISTSPWSANADLYEDAADEEGPVVSSGFLYQSHGSCLRCLQCHVSACAMFPPFFLLRGLYFSVSSCMVFRNFTPFQELSYLF